MKLARLVLIGLVSLVGFSAAATARPVTQIQVHIITSDVADAGTNAKVFLGIGGREFRLDRPDMNDFEPGQNVTYILGLQANVANPLANDPRDPPLDTTQSIANAQVPVYIRMSDVSFDNANPLTWPADDWLVTFVRITVKTGPNAENTALEYIPAFIGLEDPSPQGPFLRLGRDTGFYIYFIRD